MFLFIDILNMLQHESLFLMQALGIAWWLIQNMLAFLFSLLAEVAASRGPGKGVALHLWFCGLNAV